MSKAGLRRQNRFCVTEFLKPLPSEDAVAGIWATYSIKDIVALSNLIAIQSDNTNLSAFGVEAPLRRLRQNCENILILYNQGKCHPPTKPRSIQIIDRNLREVLKVNNRQNFHPKFYLTKYINRETKEYVYRMAVLSRNMTDDLSMDIGFGLELRRERRETDWGKEFAIFCEDSLSKIEDGVASQGQELKTLMNELRHLNPANDKVQLLSQSPGGIKVVEWIKRNGASAAEAIFVSPFITYEALSSINDIGSSRILISKKSSLDSYFAESSSKEKFLQRRELLASFQVFYFRDSLGFDCTSESETVKREFDLHAKIVLLKVNETTVKMYGGSSNLTNGGILGGNFEMGLISEISADLWDQFKAQWLPGENSVKEPLTNLYKIPSYEQTKDLRDELGLVDGEEKKDISSMLDDLEINFDVAKVGQEASVTISLVWKYPEGDRFTFGPATQAKASESELTKGAEGKYTGNVKMKAIDSCRLIGIRLFEGDKEIAYTNRLVEIPEEILEKRDEELEDIFINQLGLLRFLSSLFSPVEFDGGDGGDDGTQKTNRPNSNGASVFGVTNLEELIESYVTDKFVADKLDGVFRKNPQIFQKETERELFIKLKHLWREISGGAGVKNGSRR